MRARWHDGGVRKLFLAVAVGTVFCGCGHKPATHTKQGRPLTELAGPSEMPPDKRQADLRWDDLRVAFAWEDGELVSSAQLASPKIRMFMWPKKKAAAKPAADKIDVEVGEGKVPETLREARPVKLSHVGVRDGELLVVDATHKLRPALWINHLEATLEQVATRPGLVNGPALLTLRGRVQKTGELTLYVSADPFGDALTFSARAMLEGLQAQELYEFLRSRFDVRAPKGTLRVFIGLDAKGGRLHGVIKGLVEGLELEPAARGLGPWLKAEVAEFPVNFFSSAASTDAAAFVIPIDGDLTGAGADVWPTVISTLHNALVTALGFGLGQGVLPEDPDFLKRTYDVTAADGSEAQGAGRGE